MSKKSILRSVAIVIACLAAVTMFSNCSKDKDKDGEGGGSSWQEKKNVYVNIDGVKYSPYDRITPQDFINAGYTTDVNLDQDYEYGVTPNPITIYKDGSEYFEIQLMFYQNKKLKDCVIDEFKFSDKGISVFGGITIGSTEEEVRKIFGKPKIQDENWLVYDSGGKNGVIYDFSLGWNSATAGKVSKIRLVCFLEK